MTSGQRPGPKLLVLDGDGIGPEIVAAARVVLEAADRAFDPPDHDLALAVRKISHEASAGAA